MIEIKNGEIKELPICISPDKQAVLKQIIAEQDPGSIPEELFCLEENDILDMLPKRPEYSHKGTFGKLLLIAGSKNMAGAACFAAEAAYRIGCGLVKVYTPECNRMILQCKIPEAILSTYENEPDMEELKADLQWADTVVIGPGLGKGETQKAILNTVLKEIKCPLVMDADALNILSENKNRFHDVTFPENTAITPHFGEMSRLTGLAIESIASSYLRTSADFAGKYGLICHLKHSCSVTAIPNGKNFLNLTGNSGMAAAGSGDVLAGIIGGLLAQGMPLEKALPVGAYIHGDSGNQMAEILGKRALMASDLILGLTKLEYLK